MAHYNDLPTWPGASVVYQRVNKINTALCQQAYAASRAKPRGRHKPLPYTVPVDVDMAITAMGRGDEEYLKAYIGQHLTLALA